MSDNGTETRSSVPCRVAILIAVAILDDRTLSQWQDDQIRRQIVEEIGAGLGSYPNAADDRQEPGPPPTGRPTADRTTIASSFAATVMVGLLRHSGHGRQAGSCRRSAGSGCWSREAGALSGVKGSAPYGPQTGDIDRAPTS